MEAYGEFLDAKQSTVNIYHDVLLSCGDFCAGLHCLNGLGFIFFPGRLLRMLKAWLQPPYNTLLVVFQG